MKDRYPYQTYYGIIDDILSRDNHTCQVCGHYGVQKNHVTTTICLASQKEGIDFHPTPGWSIPKPCREKGLHYMICAECPQFREISVEYISYENLVVHHKDGDKTNQNPDNLVTVCTSCHRKLHPRGKILRIEELQQSKGKS